MESDPYPSVPAAENLRRASVVCALIGVVAVIWTSIAGHPLMGVFGVLGLALGAVNNWMLQRSVVAYATDVVTKKRFQGGVAGRLGGITLMAIAVALLIRPDGLAIFAGLAVFQVVMLIGAAVPVFRSLRPPS